MTSNLVSFCDVNIRHCYATLCRLNNVQEKNNLSTKCTAMVAKFEESFCGVMAELLT